MTTTRLLAHRAAVVFVVATLVALLAGGLMGCGEVDPVGTYRLLTTDDIVDRATLELHADGTFEYEQHQVADGKTARGEGTYTRDGDELELDDGQLTYYGQFDGDRLTLRFTFKGVDLRQEWQKD